MRARVMLFLEEQQQTGCDAEEGLLLRLLLQRRGPEQRTVRGSGSRTPKTIEVAALTELQSGHQRLRLAVEARCSWKELQS